MSGYPQTPTFPIDLRGGKGIKVNRTGPTANTIVIEAILGNDSLAPMPAGTLKANLLGSVSAPQDVTLVAVGAALGLKALAYKEVATISDVAGLQTALAGKQPSLGFTPENVAGRGQPNGYAPLGADSKVPLAFLPNYTGGGGSAPGSVTADQISDSSDVGRSVVRGSATQARTAIGVSTLFDNVIANPETKLNWANHKRDHYDKLLVKVGNPSWYVWPGGGYSDTDMHYGNTSAVTGAMHIPLEADESRDATNNLIFISAGVMGLISTASHNAAAVGIYGKANAAVNQCRIWGFNVGCGNKLSDIPGEGEAYHTNQIGGEIDVAWQQPPASNPGNSNVFGLTIAGEFQGGRPLGECSGVEVFAYNGQPWKIAYGTGHGAADKFAQISMAKKSGADGASSSQQFEFIACASGSGTSNQYRYGYLALNSGGDFVVQPNYYGQPGSLIVANASLSQNSRISPTGIFAADATLSHLGVAGNADVTGNIAASGTVQGGALNTPGSITGRDITAANDIRANANMIAQSALYCPNLFFFQGKQVGFAPEGNNIPPGYKALIVAV